MCGRYLIISSPEAIKRLFGYPEQPNFPPRYNVAPTQPIPIVRVAEGKREFALVRWGLIPAWVKDPRGFSLLINARSDSVLDKPAFRNAMRRRRCLIPADGFYEWKEEGAGAKAGGGGRGTGRRPYVVRPKDRQPVAFAGLWESWIGPNGEEVETAAIITCDANHALHHIHHRMPVVVPPEACDLWLDCRNVDALIAAAMLVPAPDNLFEAYEISSAVNRVVNDGPELLDPWHEPAAPAPVPKPASARPGRPKRDDGQATLF
jgi:putative SOS response-associated peptidase YedK